MSQNYACDDLTHRNKRQKTYHNPDEGVDEPQNGQVLTDEQWLDILKMIWSGSTPLVASSLSYCVNVKGVHWMLQQAKAAIEPQTAYAVINGFVLRRGLSQSGFQLYQHIQEHFGLIPQPTYDMHLKNPF